MGERHSCAPGRLLQAMDGQGQRDRACDVRREPARRPGRRFQATVGRGARPRLSLAHLQAAPERGRIGIFNRSHYEEVVALRAPREWVEKQRLPDGDRGAQFWPERCEDINAFERHLDRNGTAIVKFFLHVSKAEQKRRFLARLDEPHKEWKFNAADVAERARWDEYMAASRTR